MGGPIPWGVVPLSPRTRGEVVLRRPGPTTAATRSRARRASPPPTARAACPTRRSASAFTSAARAGTSPRAPRAAPRRSTRRAASPACCPMSPGDWRLADGAGRALALRSGRYDETPLDCGRSGCHAGDHRRRRGQPDDHACCARLMDAEAAAAKDIPAARSPATRPASRAPRDGGFAHVASELGAAGDLDRRWQDAAARPAPAGRRRLSRLPRAGRDPGEPRRAGACCAPTSARSVTMRRRATGTSRPGG